MAVALRGPLSRPPQGDGSQVSNLVLAMRLHPSHATLIAKFPSKKSEGRRSAGKRIQPWPRHTIGCCHLIARGRGSGPAGPLASRRSTAALAKADASTFGSAPDPRFLRPGSTGVTRFRLSLVYRAPRGPVVVPAGRGPRAARERFARPRAGTALAPHVGSHPECTLHERALIR